MSGELTSHAEADTELISEFMRQYTREFDFYFGLAQLTSRRCETALSREGIQNLTIFRAKRPDRLRRKLNERHRDSSYTSLEAIRSDIVDLAGVRIALYLPSDRIKVVTLLKDLLELESDGEKTFPGSKRRRDDRHGYEYQFAGYSATHLRVSNRKKDLPDEQQRFAGARVEIQVASVLMLAWQEVDHDLVYKSVTGTPSHEEIKILDELNGLVLEGEKALERLQVASESRLRGADAPLADHYDLATLIDQASRQDEVSEDGS